MMSVLSLSIRVSCPKDPAPQEPTGIFIRISHANAITFHPNRQRNYQFSPDGLSHGAESDSRTIGERLALNTAAFRLSRIG